MQAGEKLSLEQIRAFLELAEEVEFTAERRRELYGWVNETLRHHDYERLDRADKGLVRRYVAKMTGLSRAQATRLIGQYLAGEVVEPKRYRRRKFPQRYTSKDIALLAEVDEAHETLSGPATQKILHRAFHDFGDERFKHLAVISVAHLYNLRRTSTYRKQYTRYHPTRPTQIAIGERRAPEPEGRPGYLRVDTVHQGDTSAAKGVYHINAVDQVTQWQIVGATPRISEAWLLPVLEARSYSFRSAFLASIPTMAVSSSTIAWPRCSTSCWWSKPSRARATPTTTHWWKPRTEPSSASTWDIRTSPPRMPKPLMSFTGATSTRI